MDRKKVISIIILTIVVICGIAISSIYNISDNDTNSQIVENLVETNNVVTDEEKTDTKNDNIFKLYYLNVGNADCTLLQFNNYTMLIDGANEADAPQIIEYLKNSLGITKLNYVIATHSDEDHISGLDKIIDSFDFEKFYMPIVEVNQDQKKDKELKELISSVNKKGKIETPNINYEFDLGQVKCIIKWIADGTKVEANKSSIVLETTYGKTKFLFMGDYEEVNNKEIEKLGDYYKNPIFTEVDVLKVAHHRFRN